MASIPKTPSLQWFWRMRPLSHGETAASCTVFQRACTRFSGYRNATCANGGGKRFPASPPRPRSRITCSRPARSAANRGLRSPDDGCRKTRPGQTPAASASRRRFRDHGPGLPAAGAPEVQQIGGCGRFAAPSPRHEDAQFCRKRSKTDSLQANADAASSARWIMSSSIPGAATVRTATQPRRCASSAMQDESDESGNVPSTHPSITTTQSTPPAGTLGDRPRLSHCAGSHHER